MRLQKLPPLLLPPIAPDSPRPAPPFEGGVNGRNPSRLAPEFSPRSGFDAPNERELLFGGANDLSPSRFPFAIDLSVFEPLLDRGVEPPDPRPPKLLNSPPRAAVPALGLALEPAKPPRDPANPEFVARLPAVKPFTWFCAMVCCMRDCSRWNDAGRAILLCAPKKRCEPPPRIVEGAAARPLADKLARDGTTGRLPAIMRAPLICERVAAIALTRPAPNRPAPTVDMERRMWSL